MPWQEARPLANERADDYRGSMAAPQDPEPKKRPLRSTGGAGQAIGGILAGFDYQVFRASKPMNAWLDKHVGPARD